MAALGSAHIGPIPAFVHPLPVVRPNVTAVAVIVAVRAAARAAAAGRARRAPHGPHRRRSAQGPRDLPSNVGA